MLDILKELRPFLCYFSNWIRSVSLICRKDEKVTDQIKIKIN